MEQVIKLIMENLSHEPNSCEVKYKGVTMKAYAKTAEEAALKAVDAAKKAYDKLEQLPK